MSNRFPMTATLRTQTGKGVNRRLRLAGSIPAVFYGAGAETLSLAVDPKELKTAVSGPLKMNTLIEFDIQDGGKSIDKRVAVLKEYQIHPLRRNWLHADFVAIDLTKPIEVRIPLELTGRSIGVVNGGMIQIIRRDIGLNCLPEKIPTSITLDITDLDFGDNIHVRDVPLPEGAEPVDNPNFTVLTCVAPAEEKAAETDEEEAEVPVAAVAAKPADK